MIVCSPMCTAFVQLQIINKHRRDAEVIKRELDEAKDHIRFVMRVCATQVREHRYFLSEHPAMATSWRMADVKKVQGMDCVETVQMDVCRFGMSAVDDGCEEASAEVHKAND